MRAISRRRFLASSTAASAGLILTGTRASGAIDGANERLRIAVAGLNGRGKDHLAGWLEQTDVELAYLIDPDRNVLERSLKRVADLSGGQARPQAIADVRRALEDDSLDALSIATPNHWHSLMTIWAAQAGKHVYVEKPMSHDVAEGAAVLAAQRAHNVVIQHGTQARSNAETAGLSAAVRAGQFGRLKISYGYACKERDSIGHSPAGSPPEHLDWNLWRGPAAIDQYHPRYGHYNWHWFWKTGNGELNNQGTHQLDVARWALDEDQTHPVRAMAIGGRFKWDDDGETPNTLFGVAEYPNGQQVFFNVRNVVYDGYQPQVENEYYFEDGGRLVRGVYYPAGSAQGERVKIEPGVVTPGGNWAAFIAACRAGDPAMANGTARDAHHSCVLGHLINNSYRLGTRVPFNAKAGRFGDDTAAYEHFQRLHAIMRDGVGVPEDGAEYVVGPWLSFDPSTERHVGEHADAANALVKEPKHPDFQVPKLASL